MKKRIAAAMAAVMLAAGLLTACTQNEKIQVEEQPEEITLSFFGFKVGRTQSEVLEQIISGFEKENPGVKINYEGLANSDGYLDVLYKRIDSDEADDLFMLNPFAFTVASEKGYIGEKIYDLKGQPFLEQYNDTILALLNVDGRIPAVPMGASATGLLSNVDLLERYGLNVPETYPEFVHCCEVLTANDMVPIMTGFRRGGFTAGHIFAVARSLADINLDDVDYGALERKERSLGEMFRPGLAMVDEFNRKGYLQIIDTGDQAEKEAFASGNVAFAVVGNWQLERTNLMNPEFQYKFSVLPLSDSGGIAVIRSATPICVNAQGEHLELALKFLKYMSQRKNVEAFTESQTALSPLKDNGQPSEILKDISRTINAGRGFTDSDSRFPVDLVTEHLTLSGKICSGEMTVDEAVSYLDSLIETKTE